MMFKIINRYSVSLVIFVCLNIAAFAQSPSFNDLNKNGKLDPYENNQLTIEERVNDLLQKMTLTEKVGQLCYTMGWNYYQKNSSREIVLTDQFCEDMKNRGIGGVWATLRADSWTQKNLVNGLNPIESARLTQRLQQWVRDSTRLGIPLFIAEECPHGQMAIGTTVFPTALGRASTFDKSLEYTIGELVGKQAAAQGVHIGYGPVLDVARDPRWSRFEETYGEDPFLTAQMGTQYAKGMQHDIFESSGGVMATLKHFSAYGISEGGHNGASANVGKHALLSQLSYPFKVAVDNGALSVMTAYNDIDGIPCSSNSWLLTDILRKEWGFKGFIISDLFAINGLVSSRLAENYQEAASMALSAGVNADLGASCYGLPLLQAVMEGKVTEQEINQALIPMLTLKFRMHLFDKQYSNSSILSISDSIFGDSATLLGRRAAEKSIVLLKNENRRLPLSKSLQNIVVIGPNAHNIYNQLGDYTAPQEEDRVVTILEGIRNKMPEANIEYVKGCGIRDTVWEEIDKAVEAARKAELVIMVLGGSSARTDETHFGRTGAAEIVPQVNDMESGEGFDRASLALLGKQLQLLQSIVSTGTPVVLVMIQGRPLDISWADEHLDAIVNAWYPGAEGGNAVANVLFGDYNPAGRLPISYPRNSSQLPVYYNVPNYRTDYTDADASPLYPFGHGLSYTHFTYSDLSIKKHSDSLQWMVSFWITNDGLYDGEEVAQLYIQDKVASVVLPHHQLKQFERVFIKKGEKKQVVFYLTNNDLELLNSRLQWVVEPGNFEVQIGSSSEQILLKTSLNYSFK